MPRSKNYQNICSICDKPQRAGQSFILCDTCSIWVHQNNRKNCSGLTEEEYSYHVTNPTAKWSCDKCIAKDSSSTFTVLPFPPSSPLSFEEAWAEINRPKPNIFTSAKNKHSDFINKCNNQNNNSTDDDDESENILTTVNSSYHDIQQLNSIDINETNLNVCHVNIASLEKHIDDLSQFLTKSKHSFDIVGITEHKIPHGKEPTQNINLNGYQEFYFEGTHSSHGGAGFFVKSNIVYKERKDLDLNSPRNYECKFIEVILDNNRSSIVGCFYRHPSSEISVSDFVDKHLDPLLVKINSENKDCIFLGDFNINLLKNDSNDDESHFYNMTTSNNFTPFILQPTRLRSKTLIDNIFFNSLEYQTISGNILVELSDHLIQFLFIENYTCKPKPPEINISRRDFTNFNHREFNDEVINNVDWEGICEINLNDPHHSCKRFYDTITYHLDEFAPLKKLNKKEVELIQKPWITHLILEKTHQKNDLLKQINNEKNPLRLEELRANYKRIRNEITEQKRKGKKEHYFSFFEKNKKKSAEIWKGIRSLINLNKNKNNNIKLMGVNNAIISDDTHIANMFNTYFSNVGPNIDLRIKKGVGNYRDYLNKRNHNNQPFINPQSNFFLTPVVPAETEKIIEALDLKKSTGPISIPVFLLKTYKEFFAYWLTKLINLSFEVGVFPDILKTAKVTPIHKKNSKTNYENYRPISLLSVVSKIYEKLIYVRIYDYLTANKLIYSKQFGFQSKYSANHAIISLTEKIKSLMDQGYTVCGVFLDLEKAFDTVNHNILCDKLNSYGLRGNINNLIKSYLTNRKQFVSINGKDSEVHDITCGVPQGSSLGPLLFLIYINDFRFCLNQTESGHFADDTYLLYASKKMKSIEVTINTELKLVSNWLKLNRLSLNETKTELIFFRSKRRTLDRNIYIYLNGKRLLPVDHLKYLGIHLDKNLSWDFHIAELSKKLSRANGILSKLRHNAPRAVCINVYYALFYSHLIYGVNVWGLTTEDNLNKIEVLQNKCLRILTFSDFDAHANPLYHSLKILKLRDIITLSHVKLAYEFTLNCLPLDLQNLFTFSRDIVTSSMTLNSIRGNNLIIPHVNNVYSGINSLKFKVPSTWNNFMSAAMSQRIILSTSPNRTLNINKIHNVHQLKRNLKKYFLHLYSLV